MTAPINQRLLFIDRTDGTLGELSITTRQLTAGDNLLAALSEEAVTRIQNVFSIGPIPAHAIVNKGKMWVTLALPEVQIRTNYAAGKNGVFTPSFMPPGRSGEALELAPMWTPPAGCHVKFLVELSENKSQIGNCYLAAFDKEGRQHQLPLPNTHSGGRLCMGSYEQSGKRDAQSAVVDAFRQFHSSTWNSDLRPDTERTTALFSVKVDEAGKTTPVPLKKGVKWEDLCEKVSTEVSKMFFL